MRAADLADSVAALVDPTCRGRQSLAAALTPLRGTRVGGFVLEGIQGSKARKEGIRYALRWAGEGEAPARPGAGGEPAVLLTMIPGGLSDAGARRACA